MPQLLTEEMLNAIWQAPAIKIEDYGVDMVDVPGDALLTAMRDHISDIEQAITIDGVQPYSDHDYGILAARYTRHREDANSEWGLWKAAN